MSPTASPRLSILVTGSLPDCRSGAVTQAAELLRPQVDASAYEVVDGTKLDWNSIRASAGGWGALPAWVAQRYVAVYIYDNGAGVVGKATAQIGAAAQQAGRAVASIDSSGVARQIVMEEIPGGSYQEYAQMAPVDEAPAPWETSA